MASINEQRIDNLCVNAGFDPKGVHVLTTMLLDHFRCGIQTSKLFRVILDQDGEKKQRAEMRKDFLEAIRLPIDESKEYQDRLFQNLRDCPWMRPLIEMVLDEISGTFDEGNLYKAIITNYYLIDANLSNEEIADLLGLAIASLERKKRAAIKCFGISMYRYAYRRELEEREKNTDDGNK